MVEGGGIVYHGDGGAVSHGAFEAVANAVEEVAAVEFGIGAVGGDGDLAEVVIAPGPAPVGAAKGGAGGDDFFALSDVVHVVAVVITGDWILSGV